ncbi:MAG TPA: hypothetical protein DIC22_07385 [Chitinophagaceae bacterium]|nr:hypothetical protein [Chitinophagaceae bacterium]
MSHLKMRNLTAIICSSVLLLHGMKSSAQAQNADWMYPDTSRYINTVSGEFTPARGFDLVKTKMASLNLSIYAMVRYLDQTPGNQTWNDHLGNTQSFTGRNDIAWHRTMLWFSGFALTPKLTYTATVWTIFSTQQTLVYGNLQYKFDEHFRLGVGVAPNLAIRSMQGPFPFYLSTDRTMGEETLRPGFTNGAFLTGEIIPRLYYNIMIGNNLSTLGIKSAKDTRDLTKSFTLMMMPTTGEFGPRGGQGDFEYHKKTATRFGVSFTHARENRFTDSAVSGPDETQVRNTDGILFFQTGALAPGVTVIEANYDMGSVDLGLKYMGFGIDLEFFGRKLSRFDATGPLPLSVINDYGYALQVSKMIIPRVLMLYGINSYFWDQWGRRPWEAGGGVNVYPMKSRSWRLNLQVDYIYKCSAGGTFGLYTAGQTGTTLTLGADILL